MQENLHWTGQASMLEMAVVLCMSSHVIGQHEVYYGDYL